MAYNSIYCCDSLLGRTVRDFNNLFLTDSISQSYFYIENEAGQCISFHQARYLGTSKLFIHHNRKNIFSIISLNPSDFTYFTYPYVLDIEALKEFCGIKKMIRFHYLYKALSNSSHIYEKPISIVSNWVDLETVR